MIEDTDHETQELDTEDAEVLDTMVNNAMCIIQNETLFPLALHKAATEYLIRLFERS
jgi:predicted DNA-binding helix-hairpin-helix protein